MIKEGFLQAIKYRNMKEAREALSEVMDNPSAVDIFDDDGENPQGLLTVIPEDRLSEEIYYRLFGAKKGTMVNVEIIPYSGFGPPAEEESYMGFISEECAYVLEGEHLPIEIESCPLGARDIHHLEAMVRDNEHPINREYVKKKLKLPSDWDFEDLFELIIEGKSSGEELDRLIHRGIH